MNINWILLRHLHALSFVANFGHATFSLFFTMVYMLVSIQATVFIAS